MTIGEYLKNKRNEKGLSLRQLASAIDVSHTNISDIEKGVIKKESTILKIISALNLTDDEKKIALKLLLVESTPKDLQDDIFSLKERLIIQNNSNKGDIVVGNNTKTYFNSNQDELNLEGLSEEEILMVKNYIAFLKSQKNIPLK